MIKKKFLALGVSAVAVTAVAGAGFAGWVFGDNATASKNLGINITAAYSFGTVAVDTDAPDTVVLDQDTITLLDSDAANDSDKVKTEVTATWTVPTAAYGDGSNITYSVNVYIKDGLGTYVNCGTTSAETTSGKTDYTQYKFTLDSTNGITTTTSDSNTLVTMTLGNPLAYTSSKPDDFEAYQNMVAAIKGIEASTVATGTAYDVAASSELVIIEFTVSKTATPAA